MRVLCLDPGGLLGDLPSPVFLPEYGERFLHVAELGGLHAHVVSDFLHGGNRDDVREVWMLLKPGGERFDIERTANRVREFLEHEIDRAPERPRKLRAEEVGVTDERIHEVRKDAPKIDVFGLSVRSVEPGVDNAMFFDPNRHIDELSWFANAGKERAGWRTVKLGYVRGDDQAQGIPDLLPALALRCWMDRRELSRDWKAPHYRALVEFSRKDAAVSPRGVLADMRNGWQDAFDTLGLRAETLSSEPCHSRFLGSPEVEWYPFAASTEVGSEAFCRAVGRFSFRPNGLCISWFLRDADRELAHLWVGKVFGDVRRAIASSWETAGQIFRAELQRLHDGFESGDRTQVARSTPWDAVREFESRLESLAEASDDGPSVAVKLDDEIVRDQRKRLAQVLESLRFRPAPGHFLSLVAGVSVAFPGFVLFRELSTTVPPSTPFDGWLWAAGTLVSVVAAAGWGLWRAQMPLRRIRNAISVAVDVWWNRATLAFGGHTASLGRELDRIVTVRNLELARKEMIERDRQLGQIAYHVDRLARYFRNFGGGELARRSEPVATAVFDPTQPENSNQAYFWSATGATVDTAEMPDHNAPKRWQNTRLAGVASFSVRAVRPGGRAIDGGGRD